MAATVQFFGLLHLEEGQKTAMNVAPKDFDEQIQIYVNNAKLLSRTLKRAGFAFTLLTNDKKKIIEIDHAVGDTLNLEEIAFSTQVPKNISFYSAHFKLDAFRYLASLAVDYAALCDLDVVCINKMPRTLLNAIEKRTPLTYDISDQAIPAVGHDRILDDLEAMTAQKSEGRWMGGEYVSGTPAFFRELADEVSAVFPAYLKIIDKVHHVGDEAYTSAAIERLKSRGVYIADAGTLGIVGRYWNVRTLHPQKPFSYFEQCFLLHLPADKKLLSTFAASGSPFDDPAYFLKEYKKRLRSTLRSRLLKLRRNLFTARRRHAKLVRPQTAI